MSRLHRAVFRIGGEPVLALLADSRAALDASGLLPGPDPEVGETYPALELYLLGGEAAMRAENGTPDNAESVIRTATVEVRVAEGVHYGAWFGKADSVFDPERGKAVVVVPGLSEYHPDFVARSVCRPVLDRMLRERGYFPFHAASAAVRGKGCLIVGPAGSGKSTLLRGLLDKGGAFLSDDRAIMALRQGSTDILHFPEYLRIAVSRGRKRTVAPPSSPESRVPLRWIIFLERTGGAFRLETPGPAETAARLVQAWSPYLDTMERESALDAVELLIRNAESRVVRGWGAAGDRRDLVRFLLEEGAA